MGSHYQIDAPSQVARDAAWRDQTELCEAEAHVVVALLAAWICARGPQLAGELTRVCGFGAQSRLSELERRGWCEVVGRVGQLKAWRPSERAFRRLGFNRWTVYLHSREEVLELVADGLDVPGFGPEVTNTTGESAVERAAS